MKLISEVDCEREINPNFRKNFLCQYAMRGAIFTVFTFSVIFHPPAFSQQQGSAWVVDSSSADTTISEGELADQISIEPLVDVRTTPIIDVSADMRNSLQRQFELVKKLEEEEDAFSDTLGEAYLGYGKLLSQLGRLDEARKMYAKSLHLSKINNGVYAIEQRPVLKAMFEMHEAKGELAEMERYLKQLVWLEKKNPEISDNFSFDMVLRMGNFLIDQYLASPRKTEAALVNINRSINYMNYAVNRYGDQPLAEVLMPYGELALLYYLKGQLNQEVSRAYNDFSRFRRQSELSRQMASIDAAAYGASARGFNRLEEYLEKAQQENNLDHQIRALRDIGDLHLLFGNSNLAEDFYKDAWLRASQLDENHELVKSFERPVPLPDFNYAGSRQNIVADEQRVSVPLTLNIDRYGRVRKVSAFENASELEAKWLPRARRLTKQTKFRPPIENGKMVGVNDFSHSADVILRKSEVAKLTEAKQSIDKQDIE